MKFKNFIEFPKIPIDISDSLFYNFDNVLSDILISCFSKRRRVFITERSKNTA